MKRQLLLLLGLLAWAAIALPPLEIVADEWQDRTIDPRTKEQQFPESLHTTASIWGRPVSLTPNPYFPSNMPKPVELEVTKEWTYHISKFDDRSTSIAVANELVKREITDDIVDTLRSKQETYIRNLMPDPGTTKLVLPSAILIKHVTVEWGEGKLILTAKTTGLLHQIVPAIAKLSGNKDTIREIRNARNMADSALNEILQIQGKTARPAENTTLNRRYIEAVNRLIAADQLEKARYHSIWDKPELAIDAYTQAIEKAPRVTAAYRNRGALYLSIGEKNNAIKDIAAAAHLGDKRAQDFLASRGIELHIN